jgi:aspartate/methionine/tyrosine aminotransferase
MSVLDRLNPAVTAVPKPPIATCYDWAASYAGAYGDLLDFSQAAPGYAMHDDLRASLSALAGDRSMQGYGPIVGETVLREAYARHVSDLYGGDVAAENIQVSAGCNQAFFATMKVVAGPGDAVLLIEPLFFNHRDALALQGVRVDVAQASADDGFQPTAEAVRAALTPETRAVVLVTPNNPTGAVYDDATLQAVFDVCREAGVWLVTDETYRDFPDYPDGRPHGLLTRADWADTLIQLYSFSKAYCIPGHRLGVIAAAPAVVQQAMKVIDNLQICAPRPIQHAVAGQIEALVPWRAENRTEIARRAAALRDVFAGRTGWEIVTMGAYFAYMRHPFAGDDSVTVAKRFAEEWGVILLPGAFFGAHQDGYLRIAFANADVERIHALGARLDAVC